MRSFSGKRAAKAFRQLVRRGVGGGMGGSGVGSASFFAALASRLDMVLFRRRLRPTVVATHQLIHHQGVSVNGRLCFSPRRLVQPGDTIGFLPSGLLLPAKVDRRRRRWRTVLWDLFCRVYYRRWGLYTLRRRLLAISKKRGRRTAIRRGSPARTARLRPLIRKALNRVPESGGQRLASQTTVTSLTPATRVLLRLRYALRLRKSLLPRFRATSRRGGTSSSPRSRRRRLLLARRVKAERRRKIPRLRPVHLRIPTFLHRDFRTLRAVRLHFPSPEESVFSFRATLIQVAAFFRSQGV